MTTTPAAVTALLETLPRLKQLRNNRFLIKIGGQILTNPDLQQSIANDLVLLKMVGVQPIVVHGGGPQITSQLENAGIATKFHQGLRITTSEVMHVIDGVLTEVNSHLVDRINVHGNFAIGLSNKDRSPLTAKRYTHNSAIDLGLVGEVSAVNSALITAMLKDNRIPVIATAARGADGRQYNVNADTAAAAIAVAMKVDKLIFLTDVPGLFSDWPTAHQLINCLDLEELTRLMPSLAAGMAPKMAACSQAIRNGVPTAHLLDGREPHSLLVELLTDKQNGTMVTPTRWNCASDEVA